jgi:hypothetical protein
MATIIQILGATSITIGAGLIFLPAGFVVGGILTILIGLALERG